MVDDDARSDGARSEDARHDDTVPWRALLAETESLIGDPQHARWICEAAAGATAAEFRAVLDEPATERMVAHLDAVVARVRGGEPIQYALGSWAFRHLELTVDERVLIPRPETEEVAEIAIELALAASPMRHVADLGTGSGAIGLSMAQELPADGTTVWITDASAEALAVARANLAGVGRNGKNVHVAHGSWTEALPELPAFDVIVSNPPYVSDRSTDLDPDVREWEPGEALFAGDDGLDDLRVIVPAAVERLRPGGWLVVEHGFDQGGSVRELFEQAAYDRIETRIDTAGHDRMTMGRIPVELFAVDTAAGRVTVRYLQNRIEDYARLLTWLTRDDVLEWYEGRDQTFDLARILREYGPGGVLERDETHATIVELDGEPIGFVQLYELGDHEDAVEFELDAETSGDPRGGKDIWSLDLFIGEPSLHGKGIGRAVCRGVAEFLLDEWEAREVVILPYVENERAVAAYRAAGFVGDHVVVDHEMHEGVMRDGLRLHFRR